MTLYAPSPDHESASVAFEQADWWRRRGITAAAASAMLGNANPKASWISVEVALRVRWIEAIQIKANREHRSAA